MAEDAIVRDLLNPGSAEETLNAIFTPKVPMEVKKFFNFMETHISLTSTGMGIGLRESKANIKTLLEGEGFDYAICQNFITIYENKLLKQHYEAQEKN